MEISKNTVVSASLATLITIVSTIWGTAIFVQGKIALIDEAVAGVAYLTQKRVEDTIRSLKAEIRDLRAELRDDPDNRYVLDDIAETEDDLDYWDKVLDCMIDGKEDCI